MSSSWALGTESAKNVPISIMPVRPWSSAVVASWKASAVPLGSKYGSASLHRSKTLWTSGSSKRCFPASRSRWYWAPLMRMLR